MTPEALLERIASDVADLAMAKARPLIRVPALAESMFAVVEVETGKATATVQIPYYWAVYVHDGRDDFVPVRAKKLVWFRIPTNDPRTDFGTNYPVREVDRKYLSELQFKLGLAANRNGTPGQPFMVTANYRTGDAPNKFFEEGLAGLDAVARPIVLERSADLFAQLLPEINETGEAKIRL